MRFARYWKVLKTDDGMTARGWSDTSEADAESRAAERLQRILNWLQNPGQDLDRYRYVMDDAICEQVIDRVHAHGGEEIGVISRNAYGSLVLNVPSVMIIDIDIESKIKRPGFFARLFGAKPTSRESLLSGSLERILRWQQQHPDYAFRVYRTAAGLRAIVPNRIFEHVDASVLRTMEELDSDPLYRDLCRSQKCFRARLTPKPWRIGCESPADKFPFSSQESEQGFRAWHAQYLERARAFGVCEFLELYGPAETHPTATQIIDVHDSYCCTTGSRLA